jgi:hypothetical protein
MIILPLLLLVHLKLSHQPNSTFLLHQLWLVQRQAHTCRTLLWLAACLVLAQSAVSRSCINRTAISFWTCICYIWVLFYTCGLFLKIFQQFLTDKHPIIYSWLACLSRHFANASFLLLSNWKRVWCQWLHVTP